MGILQLVRIGEDGEETILEETPVPDEWIGGFSTYYPSGYFEKLEKYHKRTGKPKKSHIDVIYICRPQVEKWDIKLLEKYATSLDSARWELEKRRKNVSL